MGRNDMCFCGSGKKQKKCHPDIFENSIAANIIKFYNELDKEIDNNIYGKCNVKCKQGCNECCEDFFNISEVEFAIIMEYSVKTKGLERTLEFIEKGLEMSIFFKEQYPLYYEQLEQDITGKDRMDALRISIDNLPDKQSKKCIFIDETESCSIYEARPIVCRTHGLCYNNDMPDNYRICSVIPCLKANKENMLCIDKFSEIIESSYLYKDSNHDKGIMRRQYPIFYYIKMYFENGMTLNEYFKHPTISGILLQSEEQFINYLYIRYNLK